MSSFIDRIKALTKQLYPTGRAFRIPVGGNFELLHNALAIHEDQIMQDATSILDSALPDNTNFGVDDADAWEARLGLITNEATSLSDRKAAIIRKINHPGTIPARQNYKYIEGQLQAAGFSVYVYENIFALYPSGYTTRTPVDFAFPNAYPSVTIEHSGSIEHGDVEHGVTYGNKVANNIVASIDNYFDTGLNLRSTFFIGGVSAGGFANVPASREQEFRELILKLKPRQEIAFLLVNYV